MFNDWREWLHELKLLEKLQIPRYFSCLNKNSVDVELHIFTDASEEAYCAAAFLRICSEKESSVTLVSSKARVAPIRTLTIPRLELMAAVLGVRLSKMIQNETNLSISKRFYWSDSKTVLNWIRTEKKLPTFIACRVGEILENSQVEDWKWLPSKENVADICTRKKLKVTTETWSKWLHGPMFLQGNEWSFLFKDDLSKEMQLDDNYEKILNVTEERSYLPEIKSHYTWLKLIRITAWIRRFIRNCLLKVQMKNEQCYSGPLRVEECEWAEMQWIKLVQKECFFTDLNCLRNQKPIKNGKLARLSPELNENGVIQIAGRIDKVQDITIDTKKPVILDGKHNYVKLLIMHYHSKNGHQGVETVLNELRKRYWILKARSSVKSACLRCKTCRQKYSQQVQPQMAPLPAERFSTFQKPFTATGIDYFGPIVVKIGRRLEKRYGVLFTCLTTRAIHVEIAHSLNTDSCIMAVRRMMARRGQIKVLWSDNGTNLRGANKELINALEELDQERLNDEATNRGIEWRFIPPGSPHMGGVWERMISCFKRAIEAVLRDRHVSDEVLATIFAEAEFIVNSRPLTYTSDCPEDPIPLTPNNFLIGSDFDIIVPGKFTKKDELLRKQWRTSQLIIDMFWKRWLREYIPTLVQRQKWHQSQRNIEVGEVVFLADDSTPRGSWPLGVVQKIFPGEDGVVRVVEIRTQHGTFRRPTRKLYRIPSSVDNQESTLGGRM